MSGPHAALTWSTDPLTSADATYVATAPDGRVFQIDVPPFEGMVILTIDDLAPDGHDQGGIFGSVEEATQWAESQVAETTD